MTDQQEQGAPWPVPVAPYVEECSGLLHEAWSGLLNDPAARLPEPGVGWPRWVTSDEKYRSDQDR